jgi:hypothetical protein
MNNELENLDEDKNMGIKREFIDIINEYWKDDIPCIDLKNNKPIFTEDDKKRLEEQVDPFTNLDDLNRCGVAFTCIRDDTLSKPFNSPDKRPKIYSKPSGYPKLKEENTVNERLIFQRCHLIGHRLYKIRNDKGEENVNLKKIFTGTRFMNNIMYYYEKKVYEYVYKTNKHVLYRVTPYFKSNDKLVSGVQMEAMFINESGNEDIDLSFNVFVYNKQPCIKFEYETGKISTDESKDLSNKMLKTECKYVLNKKNKIFHIENCASVYDIKNIKKVRKKGEDLEKKCLCGICIPY